MKKFSRPSTQKDELVNKFINTNFYKGFSNDKIFKPSKNERCIWVRFKELISDTNCATTYSSVLVANRRIQYDEAILQNIDIKENNQLYSNLSAIPFAIEECKFIVGNVHFYDDIPKIDRALNKIRSLESQGFEINLSVVEELNKAKTHIINYGKAEYNGKECDDLITPELETYILVPLLVDNKYYNISNVKKYPVYSDIFNSSTDTYGQISFIFKNNNKKLSSTGKKTYTPTLYDGRFRYGTLPNGTDIFYIKIFDKIYNPFSYLTSHDAETVFNNICNYFKCNEPKEHMYDILVNTYNTRNNYINLKGLPIPVSDINISLTKLVDSTDLDIDDIEDVNEEDEVTEVQNEKPKIVVTGNRGHISSKVLEDLIIGISSKKKIVSLYSHFSELLFRRSDIVESGENRANYFNSKERGGNSIPKPTILIDELLLNTYMFTNNDSVNPIDTFTMCAYRKYIYAKQMEKSKINIPLEARFIEDPEDRLIEALTSKSSDNIGINSYVSGLDFYKDRFR